MACERSFRRAAAGGLALLAWSWGAAARPAASCPDTPTRVVRSVGGFTDYLGTAPGLPDLCRMSRPDAAGLFHLGVWLSSWPGAGDAYPALRAVIRGRRGATAGFDTWGGPGLQWHDRFTNEGTGSLVVGGRRYVVMLLAHEREGYDGNIYHSVITSWRDVANGMTLKMVENQIAGTSYGPSATWTATQVVRIP